MSQKSRNVAASAVVPSAPVDGNGVPILVVNNPAPVAADDKKKITTSFEGTVITWKIPRDTAPAPTVDVAKLSATIRAYGLLHGISAKVTDSAAKKKGATMAEKRAAILRTIGNLTAGNWNADRVESVGTIAPSRNSSRGWRQIRKLRLSSIASASRHCRRSHSTRMHSSHNTNKTLDNPPSWGIFFASRLDDKRSHSHLAKREHSAWCVSSTVCRLNTSRRTVLDKPPPVLPAGGG